jgi:MoaA/NifB/PqqE/SkfB family radical SAM enzyme
MERASYRARVSAGLWRIASAARGQRIIGQVDAVEGTRVSGWAMDVLQPERPVAVTLVSGDRELTHAVANQFRSDLQLAGLGTGRHGFEATIPLGGLSRDNIPVSVRVAGRSRPLDFQGREAFAVGPEEFLGLVAGDIVNNCNLRCPFCIVDYSLIHNTQLMQRESFERLLTLLPHVPDGAFWISCLHEPTLHPKLGEFMQMIPPAYARKVAFTTNLVRPVPDELFTIWAQSGIHHINVSFDTLNEELFSFLRRPGRLPVFLANLRRMTDIFRQYPGAPRLRYITMAFRSNLDDIAEIVRLTNEEHLSSENEIRYTYNVGHITDDFRRTQYLSPDEWQKLSARLESLPYRHTISLPPPGAEELDIGSANYHGIPITPTFSGPKIPAPLSLRVRMDGVVMIVDHESSWAMDIRAIDDPPAFFYDFARAVCAEGVEPMATLDTTR